MTNELTPVFSIKTQNYQFLLLKFHNTTSIHLFLHTESSTYSWATKLIYPKIAHLFDAKLKILIPIHQYNHHKELKKISVYSTCNCHSEFYFTPFFLF